MGAFVEGIHEALVAHVGAAIDGGIAVEDFLPAATLRSPQTVVVVRNGRAVEDDQQRVLGIVAVAQIGQHAMGTVVGADPLEAAAVEVALVQGRLGAHQVVERADEVLDAYVEVGVGGIPVDAAFMRPFGPLAEFAAHEQQFLARVGPHQAVEQAQVGKLLPVVARHLGQQAALAVDHFVVRERQHEVLVEGVVQAEAERVLVVAAIDRILLEPRQRVVHPAHVPLHAEAQTVHGLGVVVAVAAPGHRTRDARPGRGFLGDGLHVGEVAVDALVELAQEVDGFQVLAAAEAVGDPLAVLTGIVQVQHGGHRVHPDAVDVVLVQPEGGAGEQEAAHLVAAVVEDPAVPLGVEALAAISVFVQFGAVEAVQAVGVTGEVRGYPVQDDADAAPVHVVDERLEVGRTAVARGGSKVTHRLITPRTIERVFGDGHQLDVGEAQRLHVVSQLGRDVAVVEEAVRVVVRAHPGAQVAFVDADGGVERVGLAARLHPFGVVPAIGDVGDAGGGAGRLFPRKAEGVAFFQPFTGGGRQDAVLVAIADRGVGHEAFPDAGAVATHGQRAGAMLPAVEVADDLHFAGIRGPDGKPAAFLGLAAFLRGMGAGVGAHPAIEPVVGAFTEVVDVVFRADRGSLERLCRAVFVRRVVHRSHREPPAAVGRVHRRVTATG